MTDRDPRRTAPITKLASIEAVATATSIIDFLAESDPPVGVQEVANVLGITKSRASRHLSNLEALGLVSRGSGRGFHLGWRVIRWGQIATNRLALAQILDEPLHRLGERLERTVLLCAPAGGDAIVIQCLPPVRASIRIEVKIGLVLGLPHSPTARVCYAFQARERRQELLADLRAREPAFRVENEDALAASVAEIQQSYFCWDADKYGLGYGAIAGPVFDQDEALAAVVTIMLPTQELGAASPPPKLIEKLLDTCEQCSRLLRSHIRFPRPGAPPRP